MPLQRKIDSLNKKIMRAQSELNRARSLRLGFGLGVFILLILSQILKGYALQWAGLLAFFPFFVFFLQRSQRLDSFVKSLDELKNFYQLQMNFRKGVFPESLRPDEMPNSELARDLDLAAFFAVLDQTFSIEGKQKLGRFLCQDFSDLNLNTRSKQLRELENYPGLIRRAQIKKNATPVHFSRISKELSRSFFDPPLSWKWIVPISWGLLVFCLFVSTPPLLWKSFLLIYVGGMLAYMGETKHLFSRLQDLLSDFESLSEKIGTFERLSKLLSYCPHLSQKKASADVKKIERLISLMSLKTNPILFYILNLVVPWDFVLAEFCEKARKSFYKNFQGWSKELITLETYSSLINLKFYQNTVWPQVGSNDQFVEVQNLTHPLLDQDKVIPNSFSPQGKKVLIITGSNMSGKSTFLRALGINFCLANIGAPVFAESMTFTPMKLITCIRVSDSLRDGQSYFYAEVQRMKKVLKMAQDGPLLFLIDEPLRGTNNRERLIGNQSYLKQILNTQACGFLCTHDLELTQLSEQSDEIDNYHFSETWENQDLHFDYKIKPGPSTTTNALKILEKEGLYSSSIL